MVEGDFYAWQEQAVFELDETLSLPVPAPDWLAVAHVLVTIQPLPVPRPWWRGLFRSARTDFADGFSHDAVLGLRFGWIYTLGALARSALMRLRIIRPTHDFRWLNVEWYRNGGLWRWQRKGPRE